MKNLEKYKGIIPAFYACYDEAGAVSTARTEALTKHLIAKGVQGVYVCGSSGECIYQSVAERKATLEAVMRVRGSLTVIAHVACNNTADSVELAKHAESLGVDAIAAIPPIYFHLPDDAIAVYWNTISAAAPHTDFFIYNIPQLAGVALSQGLYATMLKNPRVAGVKNSSMPVQDIQTFKAMGGEDHIVFNGPDEQYVGGRLMGADGGIGGTYGAMPELYLKAESLLRNGNMEAATRLQFEIDEIIASFFAGKANMYAVIKEILRRREGLDIGGVRAPLTNITQEEISHVEHCIKLIEKAIEKAAAL